MKQDKEKKVSYINAAVIGSKKEGENTIIELYDFPGKYICRKNLGIKVSCGYKLGIVDGENEGEYEIVEVSQQIIKDPAFAPKGPVPLKVTMLKSDYTELVQLKHVRIRAECLNAAIKMCDVTLTERLPEKFMRKVLTIAKDLEPYFE